LTSRGDDLKINLTLPLQIINILISFVVLNRLVIGEILRLIKDEDKAMDSLNKEKEESVQALQAAVDRKLFLLFSIRESKALSSVCSFFDRKDVALKEERCDVLLNPKNDAQADTLSEKQVEKVWEVLLNDF
jgi:hypothetical protein